MFPLSLSSLSTVFSRTLLIVTGSTLIVYCIDSAVFLPQWLNVAVSSTQFCPVFWAANVYSSISALFIPCYMFVGVRLWSVYRVMQKNLIHSF